ncbi:L-serine ammonia-lyase, iron-sulfur-dependent, subunit alpha, partial [Algoriphagus aquimarinus]|uniref:L-serine ammonia-lyase, iron-sulfur-dependent, subunit alpha n=1 Tax=Algoriphagus aquimarinus TaxID=237018 RepID=UPI0030DC53A3
MDHFTDKTAGAGASLNQSISAASMALQSSLGMICDPIGNGVEAPCLNKNVMTASNALSCANMALANYEHLIPLDEAIETMYREIAFKIYITPYVVLLHAYPIYSIIISAILAFKSRRD